MTVVEELVWLYVALAVANIVLSVRDAGSSDYAKGAYHISWAVLFVTLLGVTSVR